MNYQLLRQLRKAKKLTVKKMGGRVGVSGVYISYIERGLRAPTVDVLERICNELECELRIIIK